MNPVSQALIKQGWIKDSRQTREGFICLLGACDIVFGRSTDSWFEYAGTLRDAIIEEYPGRFDPDSGQVVSRFNDAPDIDFEDVLRINDKAWDVFLARHKTQGNN